MCFIGCVSTTTLYTTAESDKSCTPHTSTSFVAVGDTIAAKSGSTATEKIVVLTIEHTGTTAQTNDYVQAGFSYTLTFGQN